MSKLLIESYVNGAMIGIKPLSVNAAYRGRRFNTKEHTVWERLVTASLPNIKIPDPPFMIHFVFGLSSVNADGDNCIKIAQDVIAKKYKFNDKLIKKWIVEVVKIPKGKEYFQFYLTNLSDNEKKHDNIH